jgi:hypothetical protein
MQHPRLVATFVDDHPPDIDDRMEMLPFWWPFHGIRFDAPVVVLVTLDAALAFGMALDIKGRNIRIVELHGVKGFCTRRGENMTPKRFAMASDNWTWRRHPNRSR